MSSDYPRLVIVEDHAVMGQALAMVLRQQGFGTVELIGAGPAGVDESKVFEAVRRGEGVVAVLDFHLGDDQTSLPMIRPLKDLGAMVLVLTAERNSASLGMCLEAGADGVFDKAQPLDQLVDLLHDAARGRSVMTVRAREELLTGLREARSDDRRRRVPFENLTKREQVVLEGLVAGISVEQIARRDVVAVSTVRSHVKSLLRKLGVNSQLAAVALARELRWEPTET